jgi:hypothetical protein
LRGRHADDRGTHRERDGVGGAQAAQDRRPLGHRRVRGVAAVAVGDRGEHDHRQRAAGTERESERRAERRVAERDADRGERPHREGEDEGREAEAEQHAVEAGGERDGQHAPPRLGHLAAHLRHDPQPARLADRRGDRERRRHDRGAGAAGTERFTELRQPAEGQHPACERAGREGEAGDERRPQPTRVARGRQRLDHRESARRPRAGDPGGERGGGEHPGQHRGTFVADAPVAASRVGPLNTAPWSGST